MLLFALCFGSWAALWYVLFQLVWAFHVNIHPDHQFREFWSPAISPGSLVLSFLMMFAPVPAAVSLAFMPKHVDMVDPSWPPSTRCRSPRVSRYELCSVDAGAFQD
jgi:hypothetical protein